jgi:hypothetical protein
MSTLILYCHQTTNKSLEQRIYRPQKLLLELPAAEPVDRRPCPLSDLVHLLFVALQDVLNDASVLLGSRRQETQPGPLGRLNDVQQGPPGAVRYRYQPRRHLLDHADPKVLIQHRVDPYVRRSELFQQVFVTQIDPELDVVLQTQVLAQISQIRDSGAVVGVATAPAQDQSDVVEVVVQDLAELVQGLQLQGVVLLGAELRQRQDADLSGLLFQSGDFFQVVYVTRRIH